MNAFDLPIPQAISSEQSVLGSLLLSPDAYDRIVSVLDAGMFFRSDHAAIYRKIAEMIGANRPVDVVLVAQELDDQGRLDDVGGLSYLAELAQNTPSPSNIRTYATLVREKWQARQLMAAGDEIHQLAQGPIGPALDRAQSLVLGIAEARQEKEPQHISASLLQLVQQIEAAYESGTGIVGLSTGLADLDAKLGGLRGGQLIIVAGRPAMGKAQPLNTMVLLKNGTWRAMGEIRLGDEIASVDGSPSRVIGVYPQGERDIFTVTFSDGRSTRACAEHLWRVMHREWAAPRIIDTSKLSAMLGKERYKNRLSVEMVSGDFGGGELPLDPYVLGVLLGDGGLKGRTPRLTSADPEILAEVQAILGGEVELRKTGKYDYNLVSKGICGRRLEDGCRLPYPRRYPGVYGDNEHRYFRPRTVYPVRNALNELGLLGIGSEAKFIPTTYLSASREDRLSLLQGLMDTDGWAEIHGSVRFSSCSRELSKGVETLVRSLGGTCSIVRKKVYCVSKEERRPGLDAWVCRIRHKNAETFFRLPRKSSRAVRVSNTTVCLNVTSIEPSGREPAQCIAVTHPSRLYVTDGYIVTHNTTLALQIANHAATSGTAGLVLSMEMPASELAAREVARAGKLSVADMMRGKLREDDWAALTHGLASLQDIPLWVDDQGALGLGETAAKARTMRRKNGLGLLVIDYLQLMRGEGENRNQELGSITRGLKALAKELDIPIIVLSQLNRKCEERANKRPVMSDLRESGDIEQDADVILFIYRDEVYNPDSQDKGTAEIIIGKQRNGPGGAIRTVFEGASARFLDYAGEHFPVREQHTKKPGGWRGL